MNLFRMQQRGQASRTLIILAAVILVVAMAVYLALKLSAGQQAAKKAPESAGPPPPTYETQVGDIDFTLISAVNMGSVLVSKIAYQPNLTTTERFIEVTIGAENKGKVNTDQFTWDVGNIVDDQGRNFTNIDDKAFYFLPQPDTCGQVLKPAFAPTPCHKMFEVSRQATGLKIEVLSQAGGSTKKQSAFLDLALTP